MVTHTSYLMAALKSPFQLVCKAPLHTDTITQMSKIKWLAEDEIAKY